MRIDEFRNSNRLVDDLSAREPSGDVWKLGRMDCIFALTEFRGTCVGLDRATVLVKVGKRKVSHREFFHS